MSAAHRRLADDPPVTRTPVARFDLPLPDRTCRLVLKLEGANEFGSIKARTAYGLVAALERQGVLRPGGAVVESSSGNLGVALAGICRRRGYRCTIVADTDTPEVVRDLIVGEGAELVVVPRRPEGNAVADRLATVRRILDEQPDTVWTNQYGSLANPEVHRDSTAPELADDCAGDGLRAVVAAVSTGGTAAGLSAYLRRHLPELTMIVVDAVGSAATGGAAGPRPRKIPGFGSGRRSDFLTDVDWDLRILVADDHAAQACAVFRDATGLALGGSAGGAVLGATIAALRDPGLTGIGVVCADLGRAYRNTIYADDRRYPDPPDPEVLAALRVLGDARSGR
ncbi:pyridoxal-phosphate dependent enzyme [Actinokineospora enzanensis]|uniref:pyridoxal-phosphate dependent enzyme n=1 Tax=Actinokineospora enzanensis TaxID=155975 RepID=UPI000360BB40|nr:pyridoxal-phosphate dependent enzyme [Actinokineospora enzanensis]